MERERAPARDGLILRLQSSRCRRQRRCATAQHHVHDPLENARQCTLDAVESVVVVSSSGGALDDAPAFECERSERRNFCVLDPH